jgi:hypothetical protein
MEKGGYEKNMRGVKEWKKEVILSVIFDDSCISNNVTGRKFYFLIKTFTSSESTNRNIKLRGKLCVYIFSIGF